MKRAFLPPKGSLQRRLGLALAGGIAVLWLVATLAAGLVLRDEIGEVFDSALQEVAQRVLPLAYTEILNREADGADDAPAQQIASVAPHREYITYIVRDQRGRVLLQSHDAEPARFPGALTPGFAEVDGARYFTESAVRGTLFVTTGERAGHRGQALIQSVRMLVWPLLVLLPLGLAGVWALVALSMRPVQAFRRDIEARGGSHLAPVDASALPAEIVPAAEAVNGLMARLRRALEAERRFTANSAHELRTPVAAALAQTQRLIAEVPAGAARERAMAIEAALRRLTQLSGKLLDLAKAEGAGSLAETPQDLVPVLGFVLDDAGARGAAADRLAVDLPPEGRLVSRMDLDAFAILARNLIENALKHGDGTQPVRVSLSADGTFRVANAGPAVPAEALLRLTRPFVRGETAADGTGLGLAIAAAIATGAGTRLDLASPVPGQQDGFEARVALPLAPEAGNRVT